MGWGNQTPLADIKRQAAAARRERERAAVAEIETIADTLDKIAAVRDDLYERADELGGEAGRIADTLDKILRGRT